MLSEATLVNNLASLQRAQQPTPVLGALDTRTARVSPDPTGHLRLEYRTAAGAWIHGASSDWPASVPACDALIVIGAALGELLDTIEARGQGTRVVVLEPDPGVATLMLARRDWRPWIESNRLRLLTGSDYRGAATCAAMLSIVSEPQIVVNPVLAAHRATSVAAAQPIAARLVADARANTQARRRFAGPYLLQTLTNLPRVTREADAAALDALARGVPAVVVGAGPSLDDVLPTLRALQDHAVIVAADTTLRPLVKGGVRPHLLVGVDPGEFNGRHLTGVDDVEDIFLAAEASLHPQAFVPFAGRTFHFKVSRHEPWPWLATCGLERTTLRAWGSVVTSAFDLALRMECDPIIFAGLDLAYTDMRPYCSGTLYHEIWQGYMDQGCSWDALMTQYFSDKPNLHVRDLHGAPVRTTPALVAFRDWLRDAAAAVPQRTVVNASGAGILTGGGITHDTLDHVLRQAPARGGQIRNALARTHAASAASRDGHRAAVAAGIRRVLSNGDRAVVDRWIQFAMDTVSPLDIESALRHALGELA